LIFVLILEVDGRYAYIPQSFLISSIPGSFRMNRHLPTESLAPSKI